MNKHAYLHGLVGFAALVLLVLVTYRSHDAFLMLVCVGIMGAMLLPLLGHSVLRWFQRTEARPENDVRGRRMLGYRAYYRNLLLATLGLVAVYAFYLLFFKSGTGFFLTLFGLLLLGAVAFVLLTQAKSNVILVDNKGIHERIWGDPERSILWKDIQGVRLNMGMIEVYGRDPNWPITVTPVREGYEWFVAELSGRYKFSRKPAGWDELMADCAG